MDGLSKPNTTADNAAPKPDSVSAPRELADVGDKRSVDLYMTYHLDHDVPFVADYYGVGVLMDYQDLSYKAEVDTIDNYLVDEVRAKRLDNSTEAVKAELKKLERLAGIDKHTPTSIRVQQLAAYSEFLRKANSIKRGIIT